MPQHGDVPPPASSAATLDSTRKVAVVEPARLEVKLCGGSWQLINGADLWFNIWKESDIYRGSTVGYLVGQPIAITP